MAQHEPVPAFWIPIHIYAPSKTIHFLQKLSQSWKIQLLTSLYKWKKHVINLWNFLWSSLWINSKILWRSLGIILMNRCFNESIKTWIGPYQRTPDQVSCDRAIRYSGFFGVRSVGPVRDFLEWRARIISTFSLLPFKPRIRGHWTSSRSDVLVAHDSCLLEIGRPRFWGFDLEARPFQTRSP